MNQRSTWAIFPRPDLEKHLKWLDGRVSARMDLAESASDPEDRAAHEWEAEYLLDVAHDLRRFLAGGDAR